MIPPYLEQLEEKVRRAAAGRRFAEVERLSAEFVRSAGAYAEKFPLKDPRRKEARQRIIDLLSWTLVMLRGAHAAYAAELRKVNTARRYARHHAGQPRQSSSLSFEA